MKSLNRREFMKGTVGAAATFAAFSQRKVRGANEKVVIGVMGLGGRGTYLAESFALRPDAEIAYLCDADTRRFARAREAVEEAQNRRPKLVQDFRRVLDDRNVDVLVNATPDHWHALGSIMACQAGKDVYVEKPKRRLCRETHGAQHPGGPKNDRGGPKIQEGHPGGHAVAQRPLYEESERVYSIRQDG
ncbi:MAG: Gfo/Idh/MocA family protein [Planctomycetota bacterium]